MWLVPIAIDQRDNKIRLLTMNIKSNDASKRRRKMSELTNDFCLDDKCLKLKFAIRMLV